MIWVLSTLGNDAASSSATEWFRSSRPPMHRLWDIIVTSNCRQTAWSFQCWNVHWEDEKSVQRPKLGNCDQGLVVPLRNLFFSQFQCNISKECGEGRRGCLYHLKALIEFLSRYFQNSNKLAIPFDCTSSLYAVFSLNCQIQGLPYLLAAAMIWKGSKSS